MEEWGWIWRRSHNLAFKYARHFPNQRVFFVEMPLDLTFALREGKLGTLVKALRGVPPVNEPNTPNLWVVTPVKFLPNSFPFGKAINNAMARRKVRHALTLLNSVQPVLWINPYWGCHYAGKMGEVCAIYDIGDDWNAIKQSPSATRWTREEDKILTERADAVIVVSEYLRRQKQPVRDDVFLIPNGVDVEPYADVWKRTHLPPDLFSILKRPVLGYTGMLHVERLDIALVIKTARAFPEATIVLLGPDMLSGELSIKLRAEPNIQLVGLFPHHELPNIMAAFDVCLVPNLVNDFSESQNPLKLFEYLASGLPIVSTNVAGFRDYPDLIRIANSPQEFIESIREALTEGTAKATLRQAAVESETWDARLDALLEVIDYAKRGISD